MNETFDKHSKQAQLFSLLLSSLLGLALFISPYQLHDNSASIFFVKPSGISSTTQHASHTQHEHQESRDIRCLRCVLYGFQLPETIAPFVIILVVLGFINLAKPVEPVSFVTPSQSARAPPTAL